MIVMTRYRKEVAEALAVGIYSLFTGLKIKKIKSPYHLKGKPINFSKYRNYKNNYFKMAAKK